MAKQQEGNAESAQSNTTKSKERKKSTGAPKPESETISNEPPDVKPKTRTKSKSRKHKSEPEDDEGLLTSQKEINATLDLIIRSFDFDEGNGELPEKGDDCDETDEDVPDDDCTDDGKDNNCKDGNDDNSDNNDDCDYKRPFPRRRKKKPFVPIPQGGVNLFLTCVDVFVFEIEDDVLEKLILCAIISMSLDGFLHQFKRTFFPRKSPAFRPLEQQLDEKISAIYNETLLQVMTGIQKASDKKDYIKQTFQSHLMGNRKQPNFLDLISKNMQSLVNPPTSGADLEELYHTFEKTIRASTLSFLYNCFARKLAEFQNAVGIKVTCLEQDLTFLSTEILRLSSSDAGILQLANALALVVSARFAEDDEFDEIFDAVEELADTIEDLAEIYRDRLKVLRALLPFSLCPRPLCVPKCPEDDIETEY